MAPFLLFPCPTSPTLASPWPFSTGRQRGASPKKGLVVSVLTSEQRGKENYTTLLLPLVLPPHFSHENPAKKGAIKLALRTLKHTFSEEGTGRCLPRAGEPWQSKEVGHDSSPLAEDIWQHLGHFWLSPWGGGEVLTGASGVEAGDAANLPVMHCTTPSHRITQPKMSTVPNERNFDPKRRSQITWRDQSQCISLLRKHANKWCIHQWWSRQHDLLIFYSFLPRHHHVGKAEVQCEGENEKLENLRFFF